MMRIAVQTLFWLVMGVVCGLLLSLAIPDGSPVARPAGPPVTASPTLPAPQAKVCRPVRVRLACNEYWIALGHQRAGNVKDHARVVRLYQRWQREVGR